MSPVKDQVKSVLRSLPDNCTMEDVHYELSIAEKVRRGLLEIKRGQGISHAEVRKRMKKWLTK